MLPHDLKPEIVSFPETIDHSIVILTQNKLRHKRFAYRLQKEFGGSVLAWYEIHPNITQEIARSSKFAKLRKYIIAECVAPFKKRSIRSEIRKRGIINLFKSILKHLFKIFQNVKSRCVMKRRALQSAKAEKRILAKEVSCLRKDAVLEPRIIQDPNSDEFISEIRNISPYFLLTLGGPLYKKELIEAVRGAAINQHAGWAPELKGNSTVFWALYHRNLNLLGSTVHLLTSGADAGPILRRSCPCLLKDDSPFHCFVRVVVLGTELIVDVVNEIIQNKTIAMYPQRKHVGKTFLSRQFSYKQHGFIGKDFSNNWLQYELHRIKQF